MRKREVQDVVFGLVHRRSNSIQPGIRSSLQLVCCFSAKFSRLVGIFYRFLVRFH